MSIVIDQVRREASSLLDAGAGVGSSTSAFFDQALQNGTAVDAETWKIDNTPGGHPPFTWPVLLCHKAIKGCSARQNRAKKRSLHRVNEHFEPDFNAAMRPSAVCDTVGLDVAAKGEYVFLPPKENLLQAVQ